MHRKSQIIWILAILTMIVVADQASKAALMAYVPEGSYIPEGPGPHFFQITHQRNPGLVGGMFSASQIVPYLAPLLATAVLIYLFRYLDPSSRLQAAAYGMIGGGAVGNYIDRVRLGSVTDFLQFHFYFVPFDFPWKYYPAFNVADSAICVGVFLLIVTWFMTGQDDVPNAA